jgi:hypothetical protein
MRCHWHHMHDFCVRKSIISRRIRSRIQKGFSPWIREVFFDEKTGGWKSRDTVPLRDPWQARLEWLHLNQSKEWYFRKRHLLYLGYYCIIKLRASDLYNFYVPVPHPCKMNLSGIGRRCRFGWNWAAEFVLQPPDLERKIFGSLPNPAQQIKIKKNL